MTQTALRRGSRTRKQQRDLVRAPKHAGRDAETHDCEQGQFAGESANQMGGFGAVGAGDAEI